MNVRHVAALCTAGLCAIASVSAFADDRDDSSSDCRGLPQHALLKTMLKQARNGANGGFNLEMWGTIVNRDGIVCAVASTGEDRGDSGRGAE